MQYRSTETKDLLFVAFTIAILLLVGKPSEAQTFMESVPNNSSLSQRVENKTEAYWQKEVSQDINPHWDKKKCNACHDAEPKKGNSALRTRDSKAMCLECHADDIVHKYIHPAGIPIPKKYEQRIKKKWKNGIKLDKDKKLTCNTCHDPLNQCLPERSYLARLNKRFLREGPYRNRTEICYKCHDDGKYKFMVAHDQIAEDGTLKLNKCRLCHTVNGKGRVKKGIKRDRKKYPLIKNLDRDRTLLCVRCHKKIDHPTSAFRVASINAFRHLVRITDEKKATFEKMQAETGMYMPLEPGTERIYCGTCHEAHQPGLFAGEKFEFSLEDNKRLRAKKICTYCHDK